MWQVRFLFFFCLHDQLWVFFCFLVLFEQWSFTRCENGKMFYFSDQHWVLFWWRKCLSYSISLRQNTKQELLLYKKIKNVIFVYCTFCRENLWKISTCRFLINQYTVLITPKILHNWLRWQFICGGFLVCQSVVRYKCFRFLSLHLMRFCLYNVKCLRQLVYTINFVMFLCEYWTGILSFFLYHPFAKFGLFPYGRKD